MKKILLLVFILTFSLGVNKINDIKKDFGLTDKQITWWENTGYFKLPYPCMEGPGGCKGERLYDYLESLKERGISIQQAIPWVKLGILNKDFIKTAITNKFTPEKYLKWKKANRNQDIAIDATEVTNIKNNIIFLIHMGFTPKIYATYVNSAHQLNYALRPSEAILLKQANLKPTKLVISVLKNDMVGGPFGYELATKAKTLKKVVNILKKNNCKVLENTYFNDADEYENEGKCYRFTANLMQRISRYTGLAISNLSEYFNNTDSNIYFVTFKDSWREGKHNWGIIKGEGSFRYTTMGGASKVVAKGRMIY